MRACRWPEVRALLGSALLACVALAGCSTVGVGVSLPIPGMGGVGVSVDSSGRIGGGVTVGGRAGSVTIGGSGRLPDGKKDDKKGDNKKAPSAADPADPAASAPTTR
jgi:hypothetical protein